MHYFTFMQKRGKDYWEITVDDLARSVSWMKNPEIGEKIIPLLTEPAHAADTINRHVDTVIAFHDYQLKHEGMESRLSEKLVVFVKNPTRAYRGFLYGIADAKVSKNHMLKLPVPRQAVRTISKDETVVLLNACRNIRDYFLLYLLFETGMRIGKALALWLEDFDISGCAIQIWDRGELENLAEIKTVASPRRWTARQN